MKKKDPLKRFKETLKAAVNPPEGVLKDLKAQKTSPQAGSDGYSEKSTRQRTSEDAS